MFAKVEKKDPIVPKMWGRDMVKVEESVDKFLQASQPFRNHLDILPSKALEK